MLNTQNINYPGVVCRAEVGTGCSVSGGKDRPRAGGDIGVAGEGENGIIILPE